MKVAKKRNGGGASENAAAAHALIDDAAGKLGKAADILITRVREQDEEIADLSQALETEQAARSREVADLAAKLDHAVEQARAARAAHEAMKRSVLTTLS